MYYYNSIIVYNVKPENKRTESMTRTLKDIEFLSFIGLNEFHCQICKHKWPMNWLGHTYLDSVTNEAHALCLNCEDTLHETILDEKQEN